jgi:hypothetical protein
MELDHFLKTAINETSGEWVLVHSIVLFNNSVLDVLLWFADEEFQKELD